MHVRNKVEDHVNKDNEGPTYTPVEGHDCANGTVKDAIAEINFNDNNLRGFNLVALNPPNMIS
jgi:hypothetical protein